MSSKKGTKRFWTAELRELAGEHLEAKAAEEAALAAAAKQLFARFSAQYAIWRNAVSCAAELDCLLSLARASSAAGMCRPAFVAEAEPFLHIKQGVNLCVQSALSDGQCIPNDIRMGPAPDGAGGGGEGDAARFLLVTGPNMGGKSTVLRQACLTVLMAHLGCWVAAEACSLSPVDRIFTRVGANDAIMAGLSTFRVELEETSLILKHATARSLVILDELGRGTATFDGMAIAHGTLRHLALETRCRCLFATHYHALSREFERANPHVALFHMACAVDEGSRAVTFLYRFQPGACNRSHGALSPRRRRLPAPPRDDGGASSQRPCREQASTSPSSPASRRPSSRRRPPPRRRSRTRSRSGGCSRACGRCCARGATLPKGEKWARCPSRLRLCTSERLVATRAVAFLAEEALGAPASSCWRRERVTMARAS